MKKLYGIVLFLGLSTLIFGQSAPHFCGTPEGRSEWLQEYQRRPHTDIRMDEELWIPIQMHIVGSDSGTGYYNLNRAYLDFCELQAQFEPSNIKLYLANDINYVNSSQLQYHTTFGEGAEVLDSINLYYPNLVNVYIAQEAAGNCGYAAYWKNTVVLAHNCIGAGSSTWAHEMGHVFSLPHTFDGNTVEHGDYSTVPPNDYERVDGSNCTFAGDGFCDTPPDYLGFRWTCNNEGLSSYLLTDPSNANFRVEGKNYMSYANDECMYEFTEEQISAMRAFIQEERPEYLTENKVFEPIEATELSYVSPPDGGEMNLQTGKVLYWDDIPNAEEYIVEVTRIQIFSLIEFRGKTKKERFRLEGDLIDGLTYYWRVRPINPANTCNPFLPVHSFVAKNVETTTAVEDLAKQGWSVSPNPVPQGRTWNIEPNISVQEEVNLRLFNITGKLVWESQTTLSPNTSFQVPATFTSGVYYLSVQGINLHGTNKLVIQ